MAHMGLDISRWNDGSGSGSSINYLDAADYLKWVSHPDQPFVFINADDPNYAADCVGFVGQGLMVGAYYFAQTARNPYEEQARFRSIVSDRCAALDLETQVGGSWPATDTWARQFFSSPAEDGDLVYSNLNYLQNIPALPYGHGLWFAGTVTPPAGAWIWQYGQVSVPGIPSPVDINRWVGTETEWQTYWASQGPHPPAQPTPPVYVQPVRNRSWWRPWTW